MKTEFHHSVFLVQNMVIRTDEMLNIVTTLSDDSGLKVTINESVKGGLITGTACTVGGIILGPVGLALGGAVGGFVAYLLGDGKFKPVSNVIMHEMRDEERQQLATSVRNIVADLDATDAVQLMVLINGNAALKGRIGKNSKNS